MKKKGHKGAIITIEEYERFNFGGRMSRKIVPLFMKKLGSREKVSSRFFRREPRMALVR